MKIGVGIPIPNIANLPGVSRPGGGLAGPDEFIFEVNAAIGDTIDLTTANDASAADFIINWGEGTNETVNATTASHTYASAGTKAIKINITGTSTPVNRFNVLDTNEGRSMVTKISNWGNNEWYSLKNAFISCTNLTVMESESTLLTASNASELFHSTFQNCTSLTNIDMSNWATNNVVWYMRKTFHTCRSVSSVKAPSSKIMPVTYFGSVDSQAFNNSPFRFVGADVAGGATWELEGLDFSNAVVNRLPTSFANIRINGNTSSFKNWKFNSNIIGTNNLFYFAVVKGTDPTFDCSGWTTLNASDFAATFRGITCDSNTTLDISNWNVSNAASFSLFMGHTFSQNLISNIVGLSTWGATAGNVNFAYAFANMKNLALTASDNFSDAFINSLTPISVQDSFSRLGQNRNSTNFPRGVPPNLASLDLTSANTSTGLVGTFSFAGFDSLPDFTNVTFPSSACSYASLFRGIRTTTSSDHLDFSSKTFKPTNLSRSFEDFLSASKVTLPSGINAFASLVNISFAFQTAGRATRELEVILPTDADYSNVTNWANSFNNLNGPGTNTLTNCVGDTLIRRLYATSLNANQQALNLGNTPLTGSPSVVKSNVEDLENAGWTITSSSTDAVMPFSYTTPFNTGQTATPTGSFTGGTFSSSNSNIAVNATTGVINTPNSGNATIRYTLADGCYNKQAIVVN